MNWTVGTYVVYLLITVPLTVWVATTLSHNGRVFLEDVFAGNDALANAVNNLPAVLVMLPLVADAGPVAVLAVLIGVNIGPNLTYVGSLATLLWRRVVADHDHDAEVAEFTRLGLLTVPLSLVLSTTALWAVSAAGGG